MTVPAGRTRVKICCMAGVEEARLAVRYGADAVGLVGPMPSGPGVIPDERSREIARAVPPPVATFLLTSETNAQSISDHHARVHSTTVQLVDHLDAAVHDALRKRLPEIRLVQVIHVEDESSVRYALSIAHGVDAIRELGGTGRTHDWSLSREIVAKAGVPVFLAGGLKPENVATAIREVKPFAVDVCSGVRTNGALDEAKLSEFFAAVRAADMMRD